MFVFYVIDSNSGIGFLLFYKAGGWAGGWVSGWWVGGWGGWVSE